VRRDELTNRARRPHLAAAEYHQVRGDPFEFGEHMRRQHHRDALVTRGRRDRREEVVAGHRVERGERLVEQEQRGPARSSARAAQAYGFEIAAATDNAGDFLAAVRAGGCDVAVVDVRLPPSV